MHIGSQPPSGEESTTRPLSEDWRRLTTADHLELIKTLRTITVTFAVLALSALVAALVALIVLASSLHEPGATAGTDQSAGAAHPVQTVVFPSGSRYSCPVSERAVDCTVTTPSVIGHSPLSGDRSGG